MPMCGNCSKMHPTVSDVRACFAGEAVDVIEPAPKTLGRNVTCGFCGKKGAHSTKAEAEKCGQDHNYKPFRQPRTWPRIGEKVRHNKRRYSCISINRETKTIEIKVGSGTKTLNLDEFEIIEG